MAYYVTEFDAFTMAHLKSHYRLDECPHSIIQRNFCEAYLCSHIGSKALDTLSKPLQTLIEAWNLSHMVNLTHGHAHLEYSQSPGLKPSNKPLLPATAVEAMEKSPNVISEKTVDKQEHI